MIASLSRIIPSRLAASVVATTTGPGKTFGLS
jgi:hypothetical protein